LKKIEWRLKGENTPKSRPLSMKETESRRTAPLQSGQSECIQKIKVPLDRSSHEFHFSVKRRGKMIAGTRIVGEVKQNIYCTEPIITYDGLCFGAKSIVVVTGSFVMVS
jgi:hypothetical protein